MNSTSTQRFKRLAYKTAHKLLSSRPSSATMLSMNSAAVSLADPETQEYWTEHNVTSHAQFESAEKSLEYFHWRNAQYIDYIQLMPVHGQDGKVVLDYGCGPGNDLVGFGTYSTPSELIGVDISSKSLAESKHRLSLHGIKVKLHQLDPNDVTLPFEAHSVDYIHSSGVLHHTPNPLGILQEFNRILKPGGTARVMVYNYNSLWMHLYVAYQRSIMEGLYPEASLREAFTRSTDGEGCPIANCYKLEEWNGLAAQAGFASECSGVGISLFEASLFPQRFTACMNAKLNPESRDFLLSLEIDARGLPVDPSTGFLAGVDACFVMQKN